MNGKPVLVVGAFVAAAVVAMTWFRIANTREPLPVIADAPDFALTERSGTTVSKSDLAGRVWIASFVYSTCPGPCPEISANVAGMKDKLLALSPDVRLVSFTIDPEKDTPEVLRKYADAFGANERWLFLTGDAGGIEKVVQAGFRVAVSRPEGEPIIHGTQLALVDRRGRIRRYYDGADASKLEGVVADVRRLLRE